MSEQPIQKNTTNGHTQHVTENELSPNARNWFENLTEQYRHILNTYDAKSMREFIAANPTTEDVRTCIDLFEQLKRIKESKKTPDDEANKKLQQHLDKLNLNINYEQQQQKPESLRRVHPYSEGLAIVLGTIRSNAYFMDTNGEITLGPYQKIETPFKQGRAVVRDRDEDHLINKQGVKLHSAENIIHTGRFPAFVKDIVRGWYHIDKNGNKIKGSEMTYQEEISFRLMQVYTDKGWIFINHLGQPLPFKPTSDKATFYNGVAAVQKNDGYHIINRSGDIKPGGPFDHIIQNNTELIPIKDGQKYKLDERGQFQPFGKRKKKKKRKHNPFKPKT